MFIINANLQIYLKWNWNQQRVRNVLGLWIDDSINVFCMPDINCIYTVSCIYCIYMWLTLAQSDWPIPTNLQWICASVHISVWWRAGRASDTDRCFAFWETRSWMSSARDPNTKPSAVGGCCELPECASWQVGAWSPVRNTRSVPLSCQFLSPDVLNGNDGVLVHGELRSGLSDACGQVCVRSLRWDGGRQGL